MNRNKQPSINPIKSVKLILPKHIQLANNIDLYWIDDVQDNTVKLDFVWHAGSKYEKSALVSNFCNNLILSGNFTQSSAEISKSIDALGGYISNEHNFDYGGFTIFGLNHHISEIFDIVKNAFNSVEFLNNEIEKLTDIKKNQFKLSQDKVSVRAKQKLMTNLFGPEHPYGKAIELEDYNNIKQDDLKLFYQNHYSTRPSIFLVGNVEKEFINKLMDWSKQFQKESSPNPENIIRTKLGSHYTEKKDALQTAIRIGKPLIKKDHKDYFKFQILNTILGGYFGSRLMTNIREDKGLTYGIGSGLAILEDAGYFFISTEVSKEQRTEALHEIYIEISNLSNIEISQDELDKVKNYILGELLRNSDGPISMMEKFKNLYFNNLSESFYIDFINSINDCSPKQIKELAQKYFKEKSFIEILEG